MYILKVTFKSIKQENNLKNILLKIKNINKLKNIKIKGILKVKQKNKIFTVLKSPHVNKKSREQFNYKIYKQINNFIIKDIFNVFNLIIIIKKILSKNFIIKYQIIKI